MMTSDVPALTSLGRNGEDVDRARPLCIQGQRTLHPLLLRAGAGAANQLVLEVDPIAAKIVPNAESAGFGNGMIVCLAAISALFVPFSIIFLIDIFKNNRGIDLFLVAIFLSLGGGALFFSLKLLQHLRRTEFAYPTILNRRTRSVVQLQGKKRVEARWDDLSPYLEKATTVGYSGASSAYHFHLVQPTESGGHAVNQIVAKINTGTPHEAAFYYEFMRSYMASEWESLPDIRLIGGIRPPPLTAFRQHGPNAWMSYPDWSQRSTLGKCLMWVF